MSAVAVHSRKQPFGLLGGTYEHLKALSRSFGISASLLLERLIALAHGEMFEGELCVNAAFVPRLRELAARGEHPPMEVTTSFVIDSAHVNAIRKLRDGLRLPRRDLVVEYVVQAAWDTRAPDDPDDGGSEDPLKRSRRASRHNVEQARAAPALTLVPPGQLSFFEEDSTRS